MNERLHSNLSPDFEEALLDFYARPDPRPAFLSQLEQLLRQRHSSLLEKEVAHPKVSRGVWVSFKQYLNGRLWRLAVVALVLALSASLLAIGPGRVLAQVQRLLGYLPGIGFVDLGRARVLPAPIQVQQGKVTLQVDEVLASPDKTLVVFSTQGINPGDLPWPNPAIGGDFTAFLRLPDGSRLEARSWQIELAAGRVEFPPIPASVDQLSLEIPRLPLVPEGAAPENWLVGLVLIPANGKPPQDFFPVPYTPSNPAVTAQGVTLEVLQIAQGAEETSVLARLDWVDPTWEHVSWSQARLSDDLGHVYWEIPGASNAGVAVISVPEAPSAPTPPAFSDEATFRLAALSLAARRATFSIPEISYDIPAQGGFTFDPGPDPQPGQIWKLDEQFVVSGLPLHLVGARLVENPSPRPERGESRYSLEFTIEDGQPEGRRLYSVFWKIDPSIFKGYGGGGGDTGRFTLSLYSDEIVRRPFQVQAQGISVTRVGPWEVSWDLPGGPLGESAVRRPQLANPAAMQHGVTLNVDEVFESDRITAVRLSASQLPPGVQLLGVYGYSTPARNNRPTLQDQWGQPLSYPQSVTWTPDGKPGYDPLMLAFAPAPLLAQKLTLSLPGVELLYPGQASFSVDIPSDLIFQPEQYTVTVIGGGGPERQEAATRQVSRHWPVDIQVEIAGYSLQFTEAWVEREEGQAEPYRLVLRGQPLVSRQGEQTLSALRFSSVIRPDGKVDQVDYSYSNYGRLGLPYGGVGQESENSSKPAAGLMLDGTSGDGFSLLPGRYLVELNGVTTWLPGPWTWSWSTVDGR